jgi:hypothetical protein
MLAALAILAVVTLLARRAAAFPAPLRVAIPAWRFFDRAVESPRLWLRIDQTWRPLEPPARGWLGWAFAPRANLALACQAAVDQLVAELGGLEVESDDLVVTAPEVTGLAAYQRVTRIARLYAGGAPFAWKIVVPGPSDYLQSPELV